MIEVKEKVNKDSFKEIFGYEYKIIKNRVDKSYFIPNLIYNNKHTPKNDFKVDSSRFHTFQVYLVSPFLLPLKTSLNGLFEDYLNELSNILEENENISFIWSFQKRHNWKKTAIEMYQSYLNGNESPSDIDILRKIENRFFGLINKISPQLETKEYSSDVEEKILDYGYSFQCIIQINSKRVEELINFLEGILNEYDYYNALRIKRENALSPYSINFNSQILSEAELTSLFLKNKNSKNDNVEMNQNEMIESDLSERINLLPVMIESEASVNEFEEEELVTRVAESLKNVGITNQARIYNESVESGSRLTLINFDIPKGRNFSDIRKKREDIQANLGVKSLSVEMGEKPNTVKLSIPHQKQQMIFLREVITREDFKEFIKQKDLGFVVGFDEVNNPIYLSLREVVHLLIAGTTGSGKSVFLNSLISTLLITNSPNNLQLILIDPKQVELQQYSPFPHVQEVITDMKQAEKVFDNLVKEMERRYTLFKKEKVKSIEGYNQKNSEKLSYIVCVVEEYADLYMVSDKEVEESIKRLGQKARASGIHLIIVTQRPSSKILSSDIQANIQNSISFNLGNNTNYRTVFGEGIPYELLGKGDGVMKIEGYPKTFQRFQSTIISPNEIEESIFYEKLANTFKNYNKKVDIISNNLDNNVINEEDPLLKSLKRIIATSKETKTTKLREELGIKMETLTDLMGKLVDEGWLIKHKNRSKGYELVADEGILNKYIE